MNKRYFIEIMKRQIGVAEGLGHKELHILFACVRSHCWSVCFLAKGSTLFCLFHSALHTVIHVSDLTSKTFYFVVRTSLPPSKHFIVPFF